MTRLIDDPRDSTLTEFQGIVRASGGHAWSIAGIETYMRREQLRYQPNVWWHVKQFVEMLTIMMIGCAWIFGILGAACGVASIVIIALGYTPAVLAFATPDNAGTMLFCAAMCLAGLLIFNAVLDRFFGRKRAIGYASWRHVDVRLDAQANKVFLTEPAYVPFGFLDSVPESVKMLMADITKEVPSATFGISYLIRDTSLLDPVLWARHGDEETAALVWDENGAIVSPPSR